MYFVHNCIMFWSCKCTKHILFCLHYVQRVDVYATLLFFYGFTTFSEWARDFQQREKPCVSTEREAEICIFETSCDAAVKFEI